MPTPGLGGLPGVKCVVASTTAALPCVGPSDHAGPQLPAFALVAASKAIPRRCEALTNIARKLSVWRGECTRAPLNKEQKYLIRPTDEVPGPAVIVTAPDDDLERDRRTGVGGRISVYGPTRRTMCRCPGIRLEGVSFHSVTGRGRGPRGGDRRALRSAEELFCGGQSLWTGHEL